MLVPSMPESRQHCLFVRKALLAVECNAVTKPSSGVTNMVKKKRQLFFGLSRGAMQCSLFFYFITYC